MLLINTVSKNKQVFHRRQIKGSDQVKTLYYKVGYPPVKYFRWIVQSQQIIDCPVTVQYVDIAQKIWGKNIAALKDNDTRKKPIHMAGDIVKTPKELVKLHKGIYDSRHIISKWSTIVYLFKSQYYLHRSEPYRIQKTHHNIQRF